MPIYALDGFEPVLPSGGDYWIAPNAVLIGKVRLGKNASIWFGAVIRGDNDWITIGENTNVQDNSVIHTDAGQPVTIGNGVTVGHRVIIHSAIIGDASLIGMGSVLLNRSRIGRNCLVGASSLVTEDKIFEDGKMIRGAPAKAVHDLSPEMVAGIKHSATGYVENARRFASGLSVRA